MLIGLCSVKGSPGVTTTALAAAARWPVGDPIVVEADPSGGDLATRFGLPTTPGMVSLATAARRAADLGTVAGHAQRLPGGVRVVVGPVASDQARAALGVLAKRGTRTLHPSTDGESPLMVDVGRIDHASSALPVVRGADALLVLARPRADELAHVASMLEAVPTWTRTPGLVLVGAGYSSCEVERELQVPVLAALPDDRRGAGVLSGLSVGPGPDRSQLGRAAARLAEAVLDHVRTDELAVSAEPEKTLTEPEHVAASGNGVGPR